MSDRLGHHMLLDGRDRMGGSHGMAVVAPKEGMMSFREWLEAQHDWAAVNHSPEGIGAQVAYAKALEEFDRRFSLEYPLVELKPTIWYEEVEEE